MKLHWKVMHLRGVGLTCTLYSVITFLLEHSSGRSRPEPHFCLHVWIYRPMQELATMVCGLLCHGEMVCKLGLHAILDSGLLPQMANYCLNSIHPANEHLSLGLN